ncbi:hypothetical protein BC941DRAFT_473193 [Chlamydoabsidia padenii]|nr:hypothetical protein BC941DRAFT_473193 [Chlamydoabsidia padenii]
MYSGKNLFTSSTAYPLIIFVLNIEHFTPKQPLKHPAKANIFNKPTNQQTIATIRPIRIPLYTFDFSTSSLKYLPSILLPVSISIISCTFLVLDRNSGDFSSGGCNVRYTVWEWKPNLSTLITPLTMDLKYWIWPSMTTLLNECVFDM